MTTVSTIDQDNIQRAAEIIAKGGVVIMPTETVYGLLCDASHRGAILRITSMKQRDASKYYARLVDSIDMIKHMCRVSSTVEALIQAFSPGPITYILRAKQGENIAVRIPDHEAVLSLIEAFGRPVVGTSVNVSGMPAAYAIEEIDEAILREADMILDGGSTQIGMASTVVDMTTDVPLIVREGPVTLAQIKRVLATLRV